MSDKVNLFNVIGYHTAMKQLREQPPGSPGFTKALENVQAAAAQLTDADRASMRRQGEAVMKSGKGNLGGSLSTELGGCAGYYQEVSSPLKK